MEMRHQQASQHLQSFLVECCWALSMAQWQVVVKVEQSTMCCWRYPYNSPSQRRVLMQMASRLQGQPHQSLSIHFQYAAASPVSQQRENTLSQTSLQRAAPTQPACLSLAAKCDPRPTSSKQSESTQKTVAPMESHKSLRKMVGGNDSPARQTSQAGTENPLCSRDCHLPKLCRVFQTGLVSSATLITKVSPWWKRFQTVRC